MTKSKINTDIYILGISAFYHDSAACLLKNGKIVAAAQEERFTRKKHDASFPVNAIKFCLNEDKVSAKKLNMVVFYESPKLKFQRIIKSHILDAPSGLYNFIDASKAWLGGKLFLKSTISNMLNELFKENLHWKEKIKFSEHHLSHAASAYFPSPFQSATVITIDGVGEFATTSVASGSGNKLSVQKEIHFPNSLGLLYSAFTYYTGFKVNSGEYKLMGLAPYGSPKYVDLMKDKLLTIYEDGSYALNMDYFCFPTQNKMINSKFCDLFEDKPRNPENELTQKHMDIAASIQKVTEDVVVNLAQKVSAQTGEKNLCLAGGVALNCVANGVLHRKNIFENIWIQPAAGDAGGALGSALYGWHTLLGVDRDTPNPNDSMQGSYLGPSFSDSEVENQLRKCGAKYEKMPNKDLNDYLVEELICEKAIGWMQGRMEFGPRALGARSIIADARSPKIQKQLNLKVKFRESFRPFAPSVIREDVSEWFEYSGDSPYMLVVSKVKEDKVIPLNKNQENLFGIEKLNVPRSSVPAITHVDYSARIQTVHSETNPKYYNLLKSFKSKTGCPVLVNTSFNVRGEPIVCSPTDAFKCFMGTDLDILVINNFVMKKAEQNPNLLENYEEKYELD